jgi:signal transduction histidine kinase
VTAATWQTAEYSVISPEDLERASSLLVAAVDHVRSQRPIDVSTMPAFVPAARLLERIRRTFCREANGLDPHAVIAVIRAVDEVLGILEQDAAQRFTGRLASFDAQQLIVEMAHDMRSPLGSILLLAERLRSGIGGVDLPAAHQRQLGLIYSAAFGLSSLASDVIELARGGATLIDTQPVPFSVSDVLQSNADILRPMAEEKRLTMEWRGPTADARVGHPAALNRVLLNLATNAIKFTNAGTVRVVASELDRVRVEFAVQDTGRGIPVHVMQHLFEAFRQRQMPGDYAFSSAGLGLSICQKLVRAMGGELQVETELERGTRFSFTLALPQATRLP